MTTKPPPRVGDAVVLALVGLVGRVAVVLWAWSRIPPVADGAFYDTLARRIALGLGYTWAWADGTVTYAAHYPVGYPALVGALYAVFGARPGVAMLANACLGSLAVFATHRIAARGGDRRQAIVAAAIVAIHPGLLTYTPALMTEGVTAALVTIAMWLGLRAREKPSLARFGITGLAIACATYVRPQSLLLVALLPLALAPSTRSWREWLARVAPAVGLLAMSAALVIAPWTARNCVRMSHCAVVSVNDGWNLLIGTDQTARGTWAEVKVPPECSDVIDEAEKNRCFGHAALERITHAPFAWLSLIPSKLARTFNYCGAGPWYLHDANPGAFSASAKLVLGAIEVVFERLCVAAALVAVGRRASCRRGTAVVIAGLVFNLIPATGYVAIVCLLLGLADVLLTSRDGESSPPAFPLALWVIGSTAVVHAMFFGAGRYEMVLFPIVSTLAAFALQGDLASRRKSNSPTPS